MGGICEPKAKGGKNLAVILRHGRENPGRRQDAVEPADDQDGGRGQVGPAALAEMRARLAREPEAAGHRAHAREVDRGDAGRGRQRQRRAALHRRL